MMPTKMTVFGILINLAVTILGSMSEMDMNRYGEGKRQFDLLRYQSEMPHYGQCWVDAMVTIRAGCKRLTDDTQTRLSLAYLNCFLALQGQETYDCNSDMEVRECTRQMRESDRGSFATFFTHTQNICYFLQAQIWHEETELTITRLADRSAEVASQLEASHQLQEEMLNSQGVSLRNQEQLMDGTQNLRGIINSSSDVVRHLFEDLKTSTLEQSQIIGDVFDQLINLRNTILGEVSSFYSIFFYVLSLLVCYLLTSAARTSGARLLLFLVMSINIVAEQTLMRWIAGDKGTDEQLYWLQNLSRRLALLVSVSVLCVCSYMYQDINEVNNQMLVEIRKQNFDIKRFLSVSGLVENQAPIKPKPSVGQGYDSFSDSDYTSDGNQASGWSDESDDTFIADENRQSDDNESFISQAGDAGANKSSLLSELSDLRRSTPVRELEGRVKDWLNDTQSQAGRDQSGESPAAHRYNLRRRTHTPSYKTSPALSVESPKSFSRTVHQLQEVSEKNSRLLRAELGYSPVAASSALNGSPRQVFTRNLSSVSTLSQQSSSQSAFQSP